MAWPTTSDPKTEFATLRFTVGEAADLDAAVQTSGLANRSAYIRDCVRRVMAADAKKAARLKGRKVEGVIGGAGQPEDQS